VLGALLYAVTQCHSQPHHLQQPERQERTDSKKVVVASPPRVPLTVSCESYNKRWTLGVSYFDTLCLMNEPLRDADVGLE
jgi:hypothetical protein